ncbi:hypothetical protein HHI36_016707 [Cryptolaemus montrouzieri]|uniref:Uncharacterized protein n=1 Tax=Cryptolaemus montrouzieri TaxID=559131 RepID=A0ABD2NKZ2_9CUCU
MARESSSMINLEVTTLPLCPPCPVLPYTNYNGKLYFEFVYSFIPPLAAYKKRAPSWEAVVNTNVARSGIRNATSKFDSPSNIVTCSSPFVCCSGAKGTASVMNNNKCLKDDGMQGVCCNPAAKTKDGTEIITKTIEEEILIMDGDTSTILTEEVTFIEEIETDTLAPVEGNTVKIKGADSTSTS